MSIRMCMALALAVAVLLVSCASPTPVPTSTPVPAPTDTPIPAADGQLVFQSRCASCHFVTDQAQVGPGLAGLFSRDFRGQPFSEEALAAFITSGSGAMPGFQLDDAQMDALIEYLREATQ
jgi:mono/diheme cytochrome c family protein